MNPFLKRKMRAEFDRDMRTLKLEVERTKSSLEIPLLYAQAWALIMHERARYCASLVKEFEELIRYQAREDWGHETLVFFNRAQAKVTFSHPDGRRLTFPFEAERRGSA